MKIHNIRIGFATNSSSTHSIIFTSDRLYNDCPSYGQFAFGWDFFTCADREPKLDYIMATIWSNLDYKLSNQDKIEITKYILSNTLSKKDYEYCEENIYELNDEAYVDHQSLISLPKLINGKYDLDFIRDLFNTLLKDQIAILGGNDNDDYSHPYANYGYDILSEITDIGPIISKWDENLKQYTLYNKLSGKKIRMSFEDYQ